MSADQIDFSQAVIHNSPDVRSWPITTSLRQVDVRADGVALTFDKKDGPNRWPDVVPPGWDGPIEYTLWLLLNIGGVWHAAGIIEYWHELAASGGCIYANNQIALNWVYDGRWGPMAGHQPAPGELVGFLVTAGDARGKDAHAVAERSNVVVVPFPSSAQNFTWSTTSVPIPPISVPTPTVPTEPAAPNVLSELVRIREAVEFLASKAAKL